MMQTQALFDQDRVAFTYADNPNGSVRRPQVSCLKIAVSWA